MRRFAGIGLAAALGTALLVGCGSSSEDAKPLDATITETGGQVRIDIPPSVEAGVVELKLTNSGQGPHSLQFVKVAGDQTTADVLAFVNSDQEGSPIPDWISEGGGIGTVAPGQTGTATFKLTEGKHIVWDDESDENDANNSARGGIAEVNVTANGGGSLPSAVGTITATEYQLTAEDLEAGNTTVKFSNDGKEFHHVIAAPIAEGSTIDDVKAFFESEGEPTGPPPIDFEKGVGTAVMGPGTAVVADWDLEAGKYAMVCFINDRAGGPPHFTMGMLNEVTVA